MASCSSLRNCRALSRGSCTIPAAVVRPGPGIMVEEALIAVVERSLFRISSKLCEIQNLGATVSRIRIREKM
jgi:hypothetical protein